MVLTSHELASQSAITVNHNVIPEYYFKWMQSRILIVLFNWNLFDIVRLIRIRWKCVLSGCSKWFCLINMQSYFTIVSFFFFFAHSNNIMKMPVFHAFSDNCYDDSYILLFFFCIHSYTFVSCAMLSSMIVSSGARIYCSSALFARRPSILRFRTICFNEQ